MKTKPVLFMQVIYNGLHPFSPFSRMRSISTRASTETITYFCSKNFDESKFKLHMYEETKYYFWKFRTVINRYAYIEFLDQETYEKYQSLYSARILTEGEFDDGEEFYQTDFF